MNDNNILLIHLFDYIFLTRVLNFARIFSRDFNFAIYFQFVKIAKVSRSEVHVSGVKRGKIHVSKLRLVWILLLIGLESGARFFNQSQSEVKQNQSKHKLLLTLNPPYRKR